MLLGKCLHKKTFKPTWRWDVDQACCLWVCTLNPWPRVVLHPICSQRVEQLQRSSSASHTLQAYSAHRTSHAFFLSSQTRGYSPVPTRQEPSSCPVLHTLSTGHPPILVLLVLLICWCSGHCPTPGGTLHLAAISRLSRQGCASSWLPTWFVMTQFGVPSFKVCLLHCSQIFRCPDLPATWLGPAQETISPIFLSHCSSYLWLYYN